MRAATSGTMKTEPRLSSVTSMGPPNSCRTVASAGPMASAPPRKATRDGVIRAGGRTTVGAARDARPGRVDAVHDIRRRRRTIEQLERLDLRSAPAGLRRIEAEALGLVHAAAAAGDEAERIARDRIVAAVIHAHHARRRRSGRAATSPPAASAAVHQNAFRLPRRQPLGDLLGKSLGIARNAERVETEDGRRGVVAVGVAGLRRKARDHHVRAEGADDPHDISQPPAELTTYLQHIADNADLYRLVLGEHGSLTVAAQLHARVERIVGDAVREGAPSVFDGLPVDVVAASVTGSALGVITAWLARDPLPPIEVAIQWLWQALFGPLDRPSA